MLSELVTPGSRLGSIEEFVSGEGTYERNLHIYSSKVGKINVVPSTEIKGLPSINVYNSKGKQVDIVPSVNQEVIAMVTRINPNQAYVKIVSVGSKAKPVRTDFSGIIRREDVRATEIDKVEIYASYRPGDIVKAVVISLGDSRSYFLSTAKAELGVIIAKSAAGVNMVPLSSIEMQCPVSLVKENRKVAKL